VHAFYWISRLPCVSFSTVLQHAYRDGRLEEVVLRHLGAADGETVIVKNIRYIYLKLLL